jgi:DNA-binding HxlR family transcriptional regulator
MGVAEAPTSNGGRSAGRTLDLLVIPLHGLILKALDVKPMRLGELRLYLGGPAQTTLRGHLATLTELGAVERGGPDKDFKARENGLTEMGRDLLFVVGVLEAWLAEAPQGPILLGGEAAKGTVKALAAAWESTMLRAFAARPLSLTQLDRLIGPISYPALERRLSAMRVTGLVDALPVDDSGTPFALTAWGSRGVGSITAAARFEYLHLPDQTQPLAPIDVEATFMSVVPGVVLPSSIDGMCQLVAEAPKGQRRLAGVEVTVDRGRISSCVSRLESKPRSWARGSSAGWLDVLVIHNKTKLRVGGNEALVSGVVLGLYQLLHGPNRDG